ncbi:hypothetical protein MROS_0800 [Melioribacter roseus P3M-2]|uniref:Uncharacterized protein n=1 Tax=Melioribacter roseus (strain DSM 23840 / JCM 17771 / VKM B-2668 / P3M-2) TaxID=1191523 RepID=I7A293_MELRP|nr:hypothetical protein [Melioribacter roseus]AFN74041.1 hypothetical protein MROS_0800 [Melioribacter roseus P3M-2]
MKKYSSVYFGIITGVAGAALFLLAIIKTLVSDIDALPYIRTMMPFVDSITIYTVLGGLAAAFIWGWVLGFFFMLIYNWIDNYFFEKGE